MELIVEYWNALSCSLEDTMYYPYTYGNYILYFEPKDRNNTVLNIVADEYDICEPIPTACHCNALLEKLIELHSDVNEILFDNSRNPFRFINRCRCYLRSAALGGFKYVELGTEYDSYCQEKVEFTKDTYSKICGIMMKRKCRSKLARITKA